MSFNMVITVSQLNSYIKSSFDSDDNLKNIFIRGEISNFRNNYQSEHKYFSLKDGNSVIRAVMFGNSAKRLRFSLKDGMMVIARGSVSSYEASGQYQIYIDDIQPDGLGNVYLEIEQLKRKLQSEGLFSQERKKSLKVYPLAVGVITSLSGSVLHDIKNVMSRRFPCCDMIVYPVKVQGLGCEEEIIKAVKYLNDNMLCDTIILARGGGSAEELNVFNNEKVARVIGDSKIPIISAVGHETDFTICDFVADVRASTPSVAAELAVPDREEVSVSLGRLKRRLNIALEKKIKLLRNEVEARAKDLTYLSPEKTLSRNKEKVNIYKSRLKTAVKEILNTKQRGVRELKSKLEVLNPENVLSRGYAAVILGEHTVSSVKELNKGERVKIILSDGEVYSIVE